MAVIVSDSFNEASTTVLTAHTPDTGSGWTEESDTGAGQGQVNASLDRAEYTLSSAGEASYSAQPNPSVADVDVEATMYPGSDGSGSRVTGVFGRYKSATEAGYGAQGRINSVSGDQFEMFVEQGGSPTSLGQYAATMGSGDTIKLEIRDGTKITYINSVNQISSGNNDVTGSGRSGIYWGDLFGDGRLRDDYQIDDFTLTEVSSGARRRGSPIFFQSVLSPNVIPAYLLSSAIGWVIARRNAMRMIANAKTES